MKTPTFSVTKSDFVWQYVRGPGKGGQKRNKTSNAVRCMHPPSGAVGFAADTRSQTQNRRLAFERCVNDERFKKWLHIEIAKHKGALALAEASVDREMRRLGNFSVEVKDADTGRWVLTDQL